MRVYHGTDSGSARSIRERGIDLTFGDESVDNAQGFYTTPSRAFAERRARTMTESARKFRGDDTLKPAILQIDIDESAFQDLCVKEFDGCTREWQEFILYNRMGTRFLRDQGITSDNHNLDFKYDVVIDETADAGIGGIVSRLRYKDTRAGVNLKAEISRIQKSDDPLWGRQLSLHSARAVKQCIRSMEIIEV